MDDALESCKPKEQILAMNKTENRKDTIGEQERTNDREQSAGHSGSSDEEQDDDAQHRPSTLRLVAVGHQAEGTSLGCHCGAGVAARNGDRIARKEKETRDKKRKPQASQSRNGGRGKGGGRERKEDVVTVLRFQKADLSSIS